MAQSAARSGISFVWLDAIHYKVRHGGGVLNRAVYCMIGLNQEGYKELLGMYINESEGAKFWLQVLTDLQNRGVEDIFIASIDNLTGFAEVIESIFPNTEIQLCVMHRRATPQIRNSQKYLSYKAFTGRSVTLPQRRPLRARVHLLRKMH